MTEEPIAAPVLSSEPEYVKAATVISSANKSLSDAEFAAIFEVERTSSFILKNGYKRIALQFPDDLLPDAIRVAELLKDAFKNDLGSLNLEEKNNQVEERKCYILGDTSYGACCVDEIAAEHADADAIVHYGRACLSPTSRLPVLHVFTTLPLALNTAIESFKSTYPETSSKLILTSSLPYSSYISELSTQLKESHGYISLWATEVLHKPDAPIPNRTSPPDIEPADEISSYSIFHIGEPIPSLVLTLASRFPSIKLYDPITSTSRELSSTGLLRRRYTLLNTARISGIIAILVNTLSASNYLPVISALKKLLSKHGKKSYTFVVGKVNIAKLSNFAEVECWCVVGCWESSLLDQEREFYAPCLTPWELKVALEGGEGADVLGWRTDYEEFLYGQVVNNTVTNDTEDEDDNKEGEGSDEESEPPVFDMRTGKYVSTSRPMRECKAALEGTEGGKGKELVATSKEKSLARIGGEISPAAAYLREKRQWTGLGSDFNQEAMDDDGAIVEIGRDGIARGYKWNSEEKT